jgi:hypothetical protein
MKKCIVRNDDKFEVVNLSDNEDFPANYVISPQSRNTGSSFFQMVENDIVVIWTNGTMQGHYVHFEKKGTRIKTIQAPQIQSVCDYMNMFSKIDQNRLKEMVHDAQIEVKTDLEKEIEDLKIERTHVLEEISKIKSIKKNVIEIVSMLKDLD